MAPIILTEEQEAAIRGATTSVPVQNQAGRVIGVLIRELKTPPGAVQLDPEVARILVERMTMENPQWRTTAEVLERLDQIDRQCSE